MRRVPHPALPHARILSKRGIKVKRYIIKRILISAFTLTVIILIMFLLMELMPGTPFTDEKLSEDQIAVLYRKYGLDKPVLYRFWKYLTNTLKGDFGVSYTLAKNMSIRDLLAKRFPVSIHIAVLSMIMGTISGILLGTLAAVFHNSILDPIVSVISMIGNSVPSYVFALGLMYYVGYKAGWLPILYDANSEFLSILMPCIALSMTSMASIARFTRTQMIDVLGSDYILLAESKGSSRARVIRKHALRNSLIPLMTIIAPMLVSLMLGSTITESMFSIPGIGSLMIQAIQVNDYNVVISLAFIYSAMYIGVMLLVDILYGIVDPRIRVAG
jgi:oligopeptide transport system permease protein